jgi:hypothetical protein
MVMRGGSRGVGPHAVFASVLEERSDESGRTTEANAPAG